MTNISIIVAIAENYAIGKNNQLLWHISDDLKRFKALTTGHSVVMGKKTYESLPKRPLPNRTNIILTDIPGEKMDGCVMAYSIEDAVSKCSPGSECFVIGGGSVYKQFLAIANKLYITWVHKNFAADVFFPKFDLSLWHEIERHDISASPGSDFSYSYVIYERKHKHE
jgi:dihydrofolate reductase